MCLIVYLDLKEINGTHNICTEQKLSWSAIFSYLYELFVHLNVCCLIFWSAILEKCMENGQWPPITHLYMLHLHVCVVHSQCNFTTYPQWVEWQKQDLKWDMCTYIIRTCLMYRQEPHPYTKTFCIDCCHAHVHLHTTYAHVYTCMYVCMYVRIVFDKLKGDQAIMQKLMYILANLIGIALAVYKFNSMGLLPTSPSDWLEFIDVKTVSHTLILTAIY